MFVALAAPAGFAGGACLSLAAFDLLRRRAVAVRRGIAALSAAGAVLAPAAPTGIDVWDGVLRAALGGGVVLLAARSRSWWWVPAAGAGVLGAQGHDVAVAAALATLGAATAFAFGMRRAPVAGALIAAALAQVALHLQWPRPHGATAVMAALVVLPMVASGLRRSPRRYRAGVVRGALAVGVLGVAGVVAGGVAGAVGAYRVEKGATALSVGLEAARQGDQAASARSLQAAGDAFVRARQLMDASWLLPARLVPVVSQHVRALQEAARAGNDLALTGAATVAAADLRALRVENGAVDLDGVAALEGPLARAISSLSSAHRRLARAAASPWLLGPVGDRLQRELQRIERTADEAEVARRVAAHLPGLLGRSAPRRYFLAIQTPSELRGSGGIIGSFGEITAVGGKIAIGRFGRDGDLNTQGLPPERRTIPGPRDYVARYARFEPGRFWQNVPASADFPSVAQVITDLYPQSGGTEVDGVVSVDPVALAALLEILGPVTVAPWPEPITADNAERVLLFDQYVRLEGTARTDFLGDVAEAVARRLTSGPLPPPSELVRALGPAVRGHHLMLYSSVRAEQALFRRVGADGAMSPVRSDFLAVVNQNASGNKVDWFLRRSSVYRARLDPGTRRITGRLTVTLRNEAPASNLPDYVIGSARASPDPPGTNHTYLSVYSPLALTRARLDGEEVLVESEREVGRNVFSQYVVVPPGQTRTVTFDLTGRLVSSSPYRLDLRAQSMAVPETMAVDVRAGGRPLVGRRAAPLRADEVLGP